MQASLSPFYKIVIAKWKIWAKFTAVSVAIAVNTEHGYYRS